MPFFKFWKCVLFGIVEYFQIMDCFKSWFMFKNASKIRIRDMCENGKPGIISKMVWGLYLKMKDHTQF